jgi:hypothetical protein
MVLVCVFVCRHKELSHGNLCFFAAGISSVLHPVSFIFKFASVLFSLFVLAQLRLRYFSIKLFKWPVALKFLNCQSCENLILTQLHGS